MARIETLCVQGGYSPKNGEPRQIPIIQSTTFKYDTSEDMGRLFDLEAEGYFYSRLQNPTCDTVAARIAALEGGSAAMLTGSGQAANFYAVFNIANAGDHVVACLYAMKALKDEGLEPKMNIRLVLGLDEETGHISADHYTEHCGQPSLGFTPDADFPLVNGELGIMIFELAQKFKTKPAKDEMRLTKLEGGVAPNAVPAYAKAVVAGSKEHYDLISDRAKLYAEETGYKLKTKKQGTSLVIEAFGQAAHGAHPDLGLNAVSILMDFLGRISFASEELNEFIDFYNDHIGFDLHGERIGCFFEDKPSGPLIFNVGMANINEDIATLSINIRYPIKSTDEQVVAGIETVLEGTRIGLVMRAVQKPIHCHRADPICQTYMKAYRDETGDMETDAMIIGGGTYAKMFNNILAFGAAFPDDENTMHQADEKFSIDSFMKMARVYARAIKAFCFE